MKKPIIGITQRVEIKNGKGEYKQFLAKVDTGADRSSIDIHLARTMGLMTNGSVIKSVKVKSALGRHSRKVISLHLRIEGVEIVTEASVVDRDHMQKKVLIGKRDLRPFLIDPSLK